MYQFPYSQPSMVSYYVQQPPGPPVLMNPPPFPTYQYGLPPAPLCYPQQLPPPQQLQQHAQPHRLHRSGSINAKIYSSDARYRGTVVLRHSGISEHFGTGHCIEVQILSSRRPAQLHSEHQEEEWHVQGVGAIYGRVQLQVQVQPVVGKCFVLMMHGNTCYVGTHTCTCTCVKPCTGKSEKNSDAGLSKSKQTNMEFWISNSVLLVINQRLWTVNREIKKLLLCDNYKQNHSWRYRTIKNLV
jgi:hypothetical protein